ncbi:hypothetical protein [Desulfolutivibrio sulfoxidireducens]|uniref:hypothetical protein n=1 Tax=Desulfolutivibrio sulfoxidireducens TaxID=2773299 RepID=UPI00159D7498|nr:hypothetical protein [Desulfolutivibrio sulfoxidireducens]QLA15246.1 hypothetical protein GD605_03380 [Desulfolutivibrio sulfoxidireducens]QLA18814.1 hypothetical protein GD604_03260 [Desulfolutivibrio sulfoxidireducens]
MELVYECNPKHKEPWQPGRKGTLCPRDKNLDPQKMLADSIIDGNKRFSTSDGIAYAAQCHKKDESTEYWHGYPEAWSNIPYAIKKKWLTENKVKRQHLRKFWSKDDLENI